MGIAYFLQFLDKLALSQATLFNLREDLVPFTAEYCLFKSNLCRTSAAQTIHGHLLSSISVISSGVGRVRT